MSLITDDWQLIFGSLITGQKNDRLVWCCSEYLLDPRPCTGISNLQLRQLAGLHLSRKDPRAHKTTANIALIQRGRAVVLYRISSHFRQHPGDRSVVALGYPVLGAVAPRGTSNKEINH